MMWLPPAVILAFVTTSAGAMVGTTAGAVLGAFEFFVLQAVAERVEQSASHPNNKSTDQNATNTGFSTDPPTAAVVLKYVAWFNLIAMPALGYIVGPMIWPS